MFANETQKTICDWADAAFGPPASPLRVAVRANEEMAELLEKLHAGDEAGAVVEAADVAIVLCRSARHLGVNLGGLGRRHRAADLPCPGALAVRANLALSRLLRRLSCNDDDGARADLVDLARLLDELAESARGSLAADVDRKMAVNRARTWRPDGTGHGYHVPGA